MHFFDLSNAIPFLKGAKYFPEEALGISYFLYTLFRNQNFVSRYTGLKKGLIFQTLSLHIVNPNAKNVFCTAQKQYHFLNKTVKFVDAKQRKLDFHEEHESARKESMP